MRSSTVKKSETLKSYFIFLLFGILVSFLVGSLEAKQSLQRLSLFFHDQSHSIMEPGKEGEAGVVTSMLAVHLATQSSIVITHATLWNILMEHITDFLEKSNNPDFKQHEANKKYQHYYASPTYTQFQEIVQENKILFPKKFNPYFPFFLSTLNITQDRWKVYTYKNLVIAVPASLTLPDWISKGIPFSLPESSSDDKGYALHCESIKKHTSSYQGSNTLTAFKELLTGSSDIKKKPLNIIIGGHGMLVVADGEELTSPIHRIAGLEASQFFALLSLLDTHFSLHSLYYQTCFSGGYSLHLLVEYLKKTHKKPLHFPLIIGGANDSEVHYFYPTLRFNSIPATTPSHHWEEKYYPHQYFKALEEGSSLIQALKWITLSEPSLYDIHGVSTLPLLLKKNTFTIIPLLPPPLRNTIPPIYHVTSLNTHKDQITIEGYRSILFDTPQTTASLRIFPYKATSLTSYENSILSPAWISLRPSQRIHSCRQVNIMHTDLISFLVESFMSFSHQATPRIYLCDTLTVQNTFKEKELTPYSLPLVGHLMSLFSTAQPIKITNDPLLSLEKVMIYSTASSVKMYALFPTQESKKACLLSIERGENTSSSSFFATYLQQKEEKVPFSSFDLTLVSEAQLEKLFSHYASQLSSSP